MPELQPRAHGNGGHSGPPLALPKQIALLSQPFLGARASHRTKVIMPGWKGTSSCAQALWESDVSKFLHDHHIKFCFDLGASLL